MLSSNEHMVLLVCLLHLTKYSKNLREMFAKRIIMLNFKEQPAVQ